MKRFIFSFLILSLTAFTVEAQSFNDQSSHFLYSENVDTWDKLKTALDSVGVYDEAKPYIILISDNIRMDTTYIIDNKNIVLRKVVGTTQKPQDFSKPWLDTGASTPGLYDGEPDFNLYVNKNVRHFSIKNNIRLVLENISLDGESDWTFDNPGESTYVHGGINVLSGYPDIHFIFAGNIVNCNLRAFDYGNRGVLKGRFEMFGGVIGHNRAQGSGGAGLYLDDIADSKLSGYSIVENNYSSNEGGGIYTRGNLTLSDHVIIRNNQAASGPGGIYIYTDHNDIPITLTLKDFVIISNNEAKGGTQKITSSRLFPGSGGGIYAETSINYSGIPISNADITINISDNVQVTGNTAARGGAGIFMDDLQTQNVNSHVYLNLTGGEIIGNTTTGDNRETVDEESIGQGGGIFAYNRTHINIPDTSTVTFDRNWAPFVTLTDLATLPGQPGSPLEGDNYVDHIKVPDIHTSVSNKPPYNNLYNNYDIGLRTSVSYARLGLELEPDDGAGGTILQPPGQDAAYLDVFGDNNKWALLTGTHLSFTPGAESGWYFDKWEWRSKPPLRNEEWDNTVSVGSDSILSLIMPPAEVTLTAFFKPSALLEITLPVFDVADSSYARPAAQPVTLKNTGLGTATGVSLSLSGTHAGMFTLAGGDTVINAGATDTSWTIRPAADLQIGTYTATVTATYKDGSGATPTLSGEVSFTVQVTPLPMLTITSPLDFGTWIQGTTFPAAKQIVIRNTGNTTASISDVAVADTSFTVTHTTQIDTVAAGADNTAWSVVPKTGLASGTYTDTLTVTYDDDSTATRNLKFVVTTPGLLTVEDCDFGSLNENYSQDALTYRPLLIRNTGGTTATIRDVALTAGDTSGFNINPGISQVVNPDSGTNVTYSVIPRQNLAPGSYDATLTVTYDDGTDAPKTATAQLKFLVNKAYTVNYRTVNHGKDAHLPSPISARDSTDHTDIAGGSSIRDGHTLVITADKGARTADFFTYVWSDTFGGTLNTDMTSLTVENVTRAINVTCTVTGWEHRTLIYDANGATGGTTPPDQAIDPANPDSVMTVAAQGDLVRDGYSFGGWQYRVGVVDTVYQPGSTIALIADTTTLKAVWTGNYLTADMFEFAPDSVPYNSTPQGVAVNARQGVNPTGAITVKYDSSTIMPRNVGTYEIFIDVAGNANYLPATDLLLGVFEITPKPVTIVGLDAEDKSYDGNTSAVIDSTAAVLDGMIAGDDVSIVFGVANFADPNVGKDKTVHFTGFSVAGSDAGNYALTGQPADVTANITPEVYPIAYDPDGGSLNLDTCRTAYTIEDTPFEITCVPVKAGRTFVGWTGSNGTTPELTVRIASGQTGALSYKAKWDFRFDADTLYNCTGPVLLSSGHDGESYQWTLPDGSLSQAVDLYANLPGRYILHTDYGSMIVSDTIHVLLAFPEGTELRRIDEGDVKIDVPQRFTVVPAIPLKDVAYAWTFGGGGVPAIHAGDTATVTWSTAGRKQVAVTVTAKMDTLICTQTWTLDLDVYPDRRGVFVDHRAAGGAQTGRSWQDAWLTLEDALADAVTGDWIWVASGTYTPPAGTSYLLDRDRVEIYGGFGGWESYLHERNFATNPTVLRGSGAGVFRVQDVSSEALIDGFVIEGGRAERGAGIWSENAGITLANLVVRNNTATADGGGLYARGGYTLDDNTLAYPVMYNSELSGNRAQRGAAMYGADTRPRLTNVTVGGNFAEVSGGGLYSENAAPELRNTVVWGNRSGDDAPNLHNEGSEPYIANSLIEGCGGSRAWNTAYGTDGGGNLDDNPFFRNPGFDANGQMQPGDYRLRPDSRAVNRGSLSAIYYLKVRWGTNLSLLTGTTYVILPFDLSGNERIDDIGQVDMGAYEYGEENVRPDIVREIMIPQVAGATTNPQVGIHFVQSYNDFVFTVEAHAGYGLDSLAVTTIPGRDKEGIRIEKQSNGKATVTILRVTESLELIISGVLPQGSGSGNEATAARDVWAYRHQLYVRTETAATLHLYTPAGMLYRQETIPAGTTVIDLPHGFYTVMLDGKVYKVAL
jgi:uncharacterized repeat protein (TIGR02543 family)